MAEAERITVELAYAPAPRTVESMHAELAAGSTVRDALALWPQPEVQAWLAGGGTDESLQCGVWGRKASLDHVLRAQDRVELYRMLVVDPKVARRERFASQGARTAGLFARRRAGAKPGY